MKMRCPICDEWYDSDSDRATQHEHPEPQSGYFRIKWLMSGMNYEIWITETPEGQRWDHMYPRGIRST